MATNPPDRLDWMAADLNGEQRTLAWYVEQAEGGDRDAALRAVRWCVESSSPAALQQNAHQLSPTLAEALRRILSLDVNGDSKVLRAARKPPNVRPEKFNRMWWWCVRMDELLEVDPTRNQDDAADEAQGRPSDAEVKAEGWPSAATVAKKYRELRHAVAAFRTLEPD